MIIYILYPDILNYAVPMKNSDLIGAPFGHYWTPDVYISDCMSIASGEDK